MDEKYFCLFTYQRRHTLKVHEKNWGWFEILENLERLMVTEDILTFFFKLSMTQALLILYKNLRIVWKFFLNLWQFFSSSRMKFSWSGFNILLLNINYFVQKYDFDWFLNAYLNFLSLAASSPLFLK